MCKKSPQAAEIEFELRHTFLKLLKSAFFVRIFAFFFLVRVIKNAGENFY
jgi:hypothetical protein